MGPLLFENLPGELEDIALHFVNIDSDKWTPL